MKMYAKLTALCGALVLLAGCSASIDDYQGTTPELKLEEFFNGPLVAHGVLQNRSGEVTRRFTATMVGTWDGDEGVLDEDFYWDDGEEEKRVWYLTKTAENTYEGTAGDVVGTAVGTTAGHALNWTYQLEVEVGSRTIKVTLDDWMYLIDENRMINRTRMTYFGFHVGDITIYIERDVEDS